MLDKDVYKKILSIYVNTQMDNLTPESMPEYNHKYSAWYKKRFKRMLRSEKCLGCHIKVDYVARRVAVFAIIVLSVFTAVDVNASMFVVNTWKALVNYFAENEVNHKVYTELDSGSVNEMKTVVRDIPSYVPEGYELESVEDGKKFFAAWCEKVSGNTIYYERSIIEPDKVLVEDADYNTVSEIHVAGYIGYCYKSDDYIRIQWDDMLYCHKIVASDMILKEDILYNIADNLYKK